MSQVGYEFKDRNLDFLKQPVFILSFLPKQHLRMIKNDIIISHGSRIYKIDNKRS